MKIRARFMGVIEGSLAHGEGEVELSTGITLKEFFRKADRALRWNGPPYFRLALKQKIPPAIMINGKSIFLPEGFRQTLFDGDEVSVILPIAGG